MPDKLPMFEGSDVTDAALKITKAGDGLSAALDLEPEALHHGERVYYVLEGIVSQVNHVPTKPGSAKLRRVHTVVAQRIAPIAQHQADPILNMEQERVARLRQEQEGALTLEDDDLEPGSHPDAE
jgi:hypothetical protein